jgi:peptide/nickel transport system substrate-binding protein
MSRVNGSLGLIIVLLVPLVALASAAPVSGAPEGQVVWGAHASLVPSWFDPAEMIQGTVFMILYAMHDAVVKPMPGKGLAPSGRVVDRVARWARLRVRPA